MGPTAIVLTVLVLGWLVKVAVGFHTHRRQFAQLPGPPHSYWFGHLKILDEAMKELPPGLHVHGLFKYIAHKHKLQDVFYLDIWPASYPFMVIGNAEIAKKITITHNMPKHPSNRQFLRDLTGDKAVVTTEGQEWKEVRSVLMPSLAHSNVVSFVPQMLQSMSIMCDRVGQFADQNTIIKLQGYLTDMTIDIIGHAIIGVSLNAQTTSHPLADNFKQAVRLCTAGMSQPVQRYLNAPLFWWYTRQITKEVYKIIQAKWEEEKSQKAASRTAIDLILAAIREGNPILSASGSRKLDAQSISITADQIKTLLLGGHDTSAAALCYAICLLSQHPEILARVREEHSNVVPANLSRAEAISHLSSNSSLVNSLPYTTAVIKETLRLFPTSSSNRIADPNAPFQSVKHPAYPGQELPLNVRGQMLWLLSYMPHHDPKYFSDPESFIPDRFVPESRYAKTHLFPSYAWRPFERGPRACAGVDFAMVEMRLALLMFLREFDVEVSYPEDAPRVPECLGGVQWYQTLEFAAKPIGGLPVKLKRRRL